MLIDRVLRKLVVLTVSCGLILPGCSTQTQRLGADDGTDPCRPQLVALDSTGNYFAQDIVTGAAIGAVGGGVIGALAGGDAKSALFGALGGAAVGAAAGYWKARSDQTRDQATLYRTVSSDIARDNAQIDKTQLAFSQLMACRKGQADQIRADYRAGRITRAQADAAMAMVRQRSDHDLQVAQAINMQIQSRGQDFTYANQQVNAGGVASSGSTQRRPSSGSSASRRTGTPADEVQVATSTNVAKRDQFSRSIASAQASQSTFEISS